MAVFFGIYSLNCGGLGADRRTNPQDDPALFRKSNRVGVFHAEVQIRGWGEESFVVSCFSGSFWNDARNSGVRARR
jgi:hypothetical protein